MSFPQRRDGLTLSPIRTRANQKRPCSRLPRGVSAYSAAPERVSLLLCSFDRVLGSVSVAPFLSSETRRWDIVSLRESACASKGSVKVREHLGGV